MSELRVEAPGKLNLCLYLGPTRPDGLHEIASLFESVSLSDTLTLRPFDGLHDRVICDTVEGENLAQRALRAAREAGLLEGPPVEVTIEKRIPVAAGMGGGSADAAAVLRLAGKLSNRPPKDYERVAFALGADVPSQLVPGAALVHGAGERVAAIQPECLAGAASRAYVIIEQQQGLSTGEVFIQSDRALLPEPEIVQREEALLEKISAGVDLGQLCALVENALEPAIVALRPELAHLPGELKQHGALAAAFTGSGPTSFGIFDGHRAAEDAALELIAAGHLAHAAVPVTTSFGDVQ
ncbi:MAG: 4-(cytidine 5'-diphospho)-2-C-methyl-D-erythritol kinase [Solirubrobacterales bacterium]